MIDLTQQIKKGEAWLVSNQAHIHYLTGFVSLVPTQREALLLITKDKLSLIHASFSPTPHQNLIPKEYAGKINFLAGTHQARLRDHFSFLLAGVKKLSVDPGTLWQSEYQLLCEVIKQNAPGCQINHSNQLLISEARSRKSSAELDTTCKAGKITAKVFSHVRAKIKAGMSEQDVCQLIEVALRKEGSMMPAFPTIVAFGEHTALAHHQPQADKILQKNQAVLLDFGASVNHYRADCTRSFWFGGEAPTLYRQIKQAVDDAYQVGIDLLLNHFQLAVSTEGDQVWQQDPVNQAVSQKLDRLSASDLDKAIRKVIVEAGFGPNFFHTSGHGLGLEIHEPPSISQYNQSLLEKTMAITIEPGIYLEGKFGYRHENTIILS